MFSLGVLIYSIYNKGKPPFDCDSNMTAFKRNVEQVSEWLKKSPTLSAIVSYADISQNHGGVLKGVVSCSVIHIQVYFSIVRIIVANKWLPLTEHLFGMMIY